MIRKVLGYGCGVCFLPLRDGHSCFVVESVKKRLAKINGKMVLVQVRRPIQVLLCKSCFERM